MNQSLFLKAGNALEHYDLIIIGAGASGLAAAVRAGEKHAHVLVLEKSDRPGRKILASGNGRCNLMNSGETDHYHGDARFARIVMQQFGYERLRAFFHRCGLLLREEEEGRIYPVTNQSASVLKALRMAAGALGIRISEHSEATEISKDKNEFRVMTRDGKEYFGEKLLIACGGAAQPRLGGCSDGYRLLQTFGHRVATPMPALVPVETDAKSISGLSGIRARCVLTLKKIDGYALCKENGEILFTDYGVSGICVMQCSGRLEKGDFFEADFLAPVFSDEGEAEKEIVYRIEHFRERDPMSLLEGILVPKLAFAVLKQAGFAMRNERVSDLPQDSVNRVLHAATHYRISGLSRRGMDQAQVTAGGVFCDEFDPVSMESRLIPGLYAAGEVMNVFGDCGGFNMMFAFSSGIVAAEHAVGEVQ